MQGRVLLGLSASSQRPGSGQVTRRCCSPPPQASEHWKVGWTGRRVRAWPGPEDTPPPPHPGTPRPHLPPGRDVPAEAGLHPAGTAGGRHSRPRLAVEGSQRPEVLCVHALHVPHRGPSATAAGALQAREQCEQTPRMHTRARLCEGWQGRLRTAPHPCPGEPASLRLQVRSQGRHRRGQDDREVQGIGW